MTAPEEREGAVSGQVSFEATGTTKPVKDVAVLKLKHPAVRENTHQFAGLEFRAPVLLGHHDECGRAEDLHRFVGTA